MKKELKNGEKLYCTSNYISSKVDKYYFIKGKCYKFKYYHHQYAFITSELGDHCILDLYVSIFFITLKEARKQKLQKLTNESL